MNRVIVGYKRGESVVKPYAVYLLDRAKTGETDEQLAVAEGISIHRLRSRLKAALQFEKTRLPGTNPPHEHPQAA